MARTWRTLMQSIFSPVLSTSLYFIVFGAAIGSRIAQIDGVSYGAFIVPGLIMLQLLTQSITNASFGIYFPRFTGTIYELLSAPISPFEIVARLRRRRGDEVDHSRTHHPRHGRAVRAFPHRAPVLMLAFLVLTAVTFSLFGFIIGIWADGFEKLQIIPLLDHHAADVPGRHVLLREDAAAVLADGHAVQPGRVPDQRIPLELL